MIRKAMVGLVVVAVGLGWLSWDQSREERKEARKVREAERRFTCPENVGSRLPSRAAARAAGSPAAVDLVEVADVEKPLGMATRQGDGSVYIADKVGRVLRLSGGEVTTLLDLTDQVSTGAEQGLLGLTFSPDGGRLYTNHTDRSGDTRITEWALRDGARPAGRELLFVEQPTRFHNGGGLAFGPDGMLYATLGDGGGIFDLWDNAQSLDTLLGKVLRIDPRPSGSRPYSIPPDNPFVDRPGARPEIWAYGFRNPWRLSFDAETGDLWVADVGDGCFEELNVERAGSGGGANYGWDHAEGAWVVDPPAPQGYVPPVYSYRRDGAFTCAVVGGYVYRGTAIPGLRGWYVFGDLCNGQILAWQGPGTGEPRSLGRSVSSLTSFGVDQAGELYATSLVGEVFQLVPAGTSSP
ncbi:MAG: PQQ-dependent sugar dehydrogenase [Acidimicrobiales bacterium]